MSYNQKFLDRMISEYEKEIYETHKDTEVGEQLKFLTPGDIDNDIEMGVWEDYCYMVGFLDALRMLRKSLN